MDADVLSAIGQPSKHFNSLVTNNALHCFKPGPRHGMNFSSSSISFSVTESADLL